MLLLSKLIDLHYYNSSISYFDRFDYVSTITQELLFVHALERFMSWYVSIYDSTLRTLFLEFYRILNHSLAITTHAIDIGLFTTMLWSFEEREKLINFSEVLSGNRFHAAFLLMGRLRYDISLRWIECFIYWLIHFTRKLKEIHHILSINRLWISRLYDIGFIERDFCFYFGFSGLLSRSAKIWMDARFLGYECYQCWDYSIFFGSNSDCLDRYLLRFNEMIESCRIIYGIVFLFCYEACFLSAYYSVSSFSIMEWLISTFLITFPFILSLHQSLKLSIESSKGIYSIFLNCFPYWTTYIISNDFLTLNQLNKFCRCINLGDLIALLGSIDFVLGSIDLIGAFFQLCLFLLGSLILPLLINSLFYDW
jgi:NADH:ubiquinone oxidoreductase subunit D